MRDDGEDECRAALGRVNFGRLACARDNQPYIVPIYFAYDGHHVYGFSTPGQKIDWGMWQHMLWVGLLMAGTALFAQAWALHTGSAHWQTMLFIVLSLSQLGHVLAIRSERHSLVRQGVWSNRALFLVVLGTAALQLATIYAPPLNPIFRTEPLSPAELIFCLLLSAVVFVAVEIEKWMVRRGWLYQPRNA